MAAKVVFLVAALMLAAFVVAEAHEHAKKPEKSSLKVVLHNLATRDVSFKNANFPKYSSEVVVAKGKWSAIDPVVVSFEYPVMRLIVSTKMNNGTPRSKLLKLDLVHWFRKSLEGKKFIVLTAVESWKKEFLFVKLNGAIIRIVKL